MGEVKQQRNQHLALTGLLRAIVIGCLTGFVVSIFRLSIQHLLAVVTRCFAYFHSHPQWLLPWALLMVVLGLLLGKLAQHNPNIKGSGIPQVEGQLMGEFDEKWWPVLWRKFLGGIVAIGSGLYLGREGPSIQLGATIGQGVAETTKSDQLQRRVGIASGAAAGLSAAFNAPVASTMFVLEEIYHNFSPLVWMATFVSALASNLVSVQFFGLRPDLNVPHEAYLPLANYWQLIILGIILGLLGRVYQLVVLRLGRWTGKVRWLPKCAYPVIPLLLVMPIAWYWPVTLGGGNRLVETLQFMQPTLLLFLGLFALRFVFSMVSYASELPGGIFLPILTLGATLGAAFCVLLHGMGLSSYRYLPDFIIYAMAGYFACISKAPFTAILLITEMVGSLAHLMPLAIVSMTAYLVVDELHGAPVYRAMFLNFIGKHPQEITKGTHELEVTVYAGSQLDGKLIADVPWPAHTLVTAIFRGEQQIVPRGHQKINAGDTLVLTLGAVQPVVDAKWIKAAAHNSQA